MKKLTLLFAFVLSLLFSFGCCANLSKINSPPQDLVGHLKNATAALVENYDGDYLTYCAAVWINKDHLITARHCVEDDNLNVEIGMLVKFQIRKDFENHYPFSKNKKAYLAEVIAAGDDSKDIAILHSLDDVEHDIATVANYQPFAGQEVHHIGHQSGLQFGYIKAFISEDRVIFAFGEDRHVLNIVGFVWPGSSGGGAFDGKGSLLGISSLLKMNTPGQSFFVHLDDIKEFLEGNKIEYFTP